MARCWPLLVALPVSVAAQERPALLDSARVGALRRLRRRRAVAPAPVDPRAKRLAVGAAVALVGCFLLFGFGFIAASNRDLSRGAGITFGLDGADLVLLRSAWTLPVFALGCIVGAVRAWRRRWWGVVDRLCLSIAAIGGAAITHFLVWWGYLPGRW